MWYNKDGDTMKVKLKIKPIIILVAIVLAIVFGIIFLVKTISYHKTYDYKLGKVGYTEEEVTTLKKLDDTSLDYLLTIPYNKWIKYIWKVLLTLFVIVLIAAIILFVLI